MVSPAGVHTARPAQTAANARPDAQIKCVQVDLFMSKLTKEPEFNCRQRMCRTSLILPQIK